jgi:hypothetical protein
MTPYASAVAIALNQAFGTSGQTAAAEPFAAAAGSSIMFFTQYRVYATLRATN